MRGQVLAGNEPAGFGVPEVLEEDLELVVTAEDALRLVLHRAVFAESGQDLVDVTGVQAPCVIGEQFLDFEAVLDRNLGAGHYASPFGMCYFRAVQATGSRLMPRWKLERR